MKTELLTIEQYWDNTLYNTVNTFRIDKDSSMKELLAEIDLKRRTYNKLYYVIE